MINDYAYPDSHAADGFMSIGTVASSPLPDTLVLVTAPVTVLVQVLVQVLMEQVVVQEVLLPSCLFARLRECFL